LFIDLFFFYSACSFCSFIYNWLANIILSVAVHWFIHWSSCFFVHSGVRSSCSVTSD